MRLPKCFKQYIDSTAPTHPVIPGSHKKGQVGGSEGRSYMCVTVNSVRNDHRTLVLIEGPYKTSVR